MPWLRRALPVLLCAAPLVWLPGGLMQFTGPKLLVAAVVVAGATWLPPRGRLPRDVVAVGFAGLALVALAALVGDTPVASLLGRWPRYEGLPVLALYAACAWAGARLFGPADEVASALRRPLVVASVLLLLFALVELAGWSPLGTADVERTGSIVGNASDLGLVAALLTVAALPGALSARAARSPWPWLPVVAGIATVLLSGSRGGLLALLAGTVTDAWASRSSLSKLSRRAALATAAGVVLLGSLAAWALPRLTSTGTVEGRFWLWRDSWDLVAAHLAAGIGPNRYVDVLGRHHSDEWVTRVGMQNPPDSAHTWPLQLWVVGGLPLLAVAVTLLVLVLRHGAVAVTRDPGRWPLLAAGVAYAFGLLTHFTTAATASFVAFLVGALVSTPVTAPESARPVVRATKCAAKAGSALLVVLIAMATVAELPLRQGVEAAARGEVAEADDAFERAHRWRWWDSDLDLVAAQSMANLATHDVPGAAGAAMRWSERPMERTPESAEAQLVRAIALMATGDPSQAAQLLDGAIETHPHHLPLRVQRAIASLLVGDLDRAAVDVDHVLRIDPQETTALRLREVIDEARASSTAP